uniref:40S ribosomal protein S15a n=1 Tax=Ditylenchus dipsaci TaxID=166011 RepID=A0A915EC95_9BILA
MTKNRFCLTTEPSNGRAEVHQQCERRGKTQVIIRPSSKVIVRFLTVMMKHGYIGEFEIVDDHRAGKIIVNLKGRINKCSVISPRFDISLADLEKWTSNLLPSRQFGYLVLTTSAGIIDHEEARRKHQGGRSWDSFSEEKKFKLSKDKKTDLLLLLLNF